MTTNQKKGVTLAGLGAAAVAWYAGSRGIVLPPEVLEPVLEPPARLVVDVVGGALGLVVGIFTLFRKDTKA